MTTLNFDAALTKQLRERYEEAKEAGLDVFDFHGVPVLVAYAKYLLEYLETRVEP